MLKDNINILIIDDDEVDRITIQRSIRKAKIQGTIDMADRGNLGLYFLEQKEYDCIFIDYLLPDTDGLTLLKTIREQENLTPIVIVTSHGEERTGIEAIKNGASDYITKNLITPESISHSILNAIKFHEIERARRNSEMALLQSEARLREAQKLAKLGSWTVDLESKTLSLSDEIYNIFEMDKSIVPSYDDFLAYLQSDDIAISQAVFETAVELKNPYHLNYSIVLPTGKVKHINVNGTPVIGEKGEITQIVSTVQDITDLISTQNALKESEKQYQMLIETMNEGVLHLDNNQTILFANKRFCDLLDYQKEEVIGQSLFKFISDAPNKKITDGTSLPEQTSNDHFEIDLTKKNGELVYFLIGISPLVNAAEEETGSLYTFTDITARKKMEEALISSEKLLRTLFDNVQGFICTHKLNGSIISVNKAGAAIAEMQPAEIEGLNLMDFMEENLRSQFKIYLKKVKQNKEARGIFPFTNHLNGHKHYLLYQNVLHLEPGKEPYVIVTAQDITERINSEKELTKAKLIAERSVKVKDQFLANMSHEIRTPMNGIIGLTNVLLDMSQDEEQLNYLYAIQSSADKLLVIINDILDFSKIEAGKIDFEETGFSPKNLLQESIQLFNAKATEKNNELEAVIDAGVPEMVTGDPGKLSQVLNNLIGNAVKFTENGQIKVFIQIKSEEEEYIWLTFIIQDTGIGIPPDKLNSVFESFTQASNDTSRKYGGTGLGLTISKQFIELQDGTIRVESKVNEGCTFTFWLPFRKCIAPLVQSRPDLANPDIIHPAELGTLNLLVAEDNKVNQLLIKKIVSVWGYELDIAANGLEALELFKRNTYDVILTDIQMPEMDGYELTAQIRKSNTAKSKVPIIALTAHASQIEKEKCLQAGTDSYISKPFKIENLLLEIASLVRKNSDFKSSLPNNPKPDHKVINLDYLREVADRDVEFIREIIQMFTQQTPEIINQLIELAKDSRWSDLKDMVFTLKSMVVIVGSKEYEDVLAYIQKHAASTAQTNKVMPLLMQAKSINEKAIRELNTELEIL